MLAWSEAKPTRREIPTIVALLLWIAACPFLFFPHRAPLVTAVLAVGLLIIGPGLAWRGGKTLPATPLNSFLLIYLLLSVTSFLVGPLPSATLRRLTTLFAGSVGYGTLLLWLKAAPGRKQILAVGLALIGSGIAIMGLFTIEWPSRYLINLSTLTGRLPHLSNKFAIHHNEMAGLILLLLPLSLALWQQAGQRRPSRGTYLFWAIISFFMGLTFLLTQSRNAFLAALLAVLAAWAWGRTSSRFILLLFLFFLTLPFLAALLPNTLDHPLSTGLAALDQASKIGPAPDQSWLARLEIWKAAAHIMIDYPLLGSGLYSFAHVSRANEVYHTIHPTFDLSHAHNLFLQTGASLGWAGWVTAAGLWGTALTLLWQSATTTPSKQGWLRRALAAAVAGYLVFNSFDVLALEQRGGLVVWVMLALVASITYSIESTRRIYWGVRPLSFIPLLLWLLLLLTPIRNGNLARLQLDKARLSTEGKLPAADRLAGDPRRLGILFYIQGNKTQALQQWQADPQAPIFLQNQGQQAHFAQNDPAQAVEWYTLALALDSAVEVGTVYFYRGAAHQTLGATEKALADYQQAVAYGQGATLWYGESLEAAAWAGQGQVLARQGMWQAAAVAFNRAVTLAPHKSDYQRQLEDVLQALAEQDAQGVR